MAEVGFPTESADFGDSGQRLVGGLEQGSSFEQSLGQHLLATLLITAGRLADSLGRRRCSFAGLIIFGVASTGCALAPTLPVLIGCRALQALGAAVLMPASLSFALSAFPDRNRGTAVGVWAAVAAVAASGGPVLGGLLITLSWRWIFLINIPLVAATIVTGLRSLPADGERHIRRLDVLGATLVFAATGLVCTALVQTSVWPAWDSGAHTAWQHC